MYQFLIESLEQERKSKDTSIHDFTKGIVSERMYRRYLSMENEISYQVLNRLLERLGFSMERFVAYLSRIQQIASLNEYKLKDFIVNGHYKLAEEFYIKNEFKSLHSAIRFHYLPTLILKLKLKTNKITYNTYITEASKILRIPLIFSYMTITRTQLEGLLVHGMIVDDILKDKIARFIYSVLKSPNKKILTFDPIVTKLHAYNGVAAMLLSKQQLNNRDLGIIKKSLYETAILLSSSHDMFQLVRFHISRYKFHLQRNNTKQMENSFLVLCATNFLNNLQSDEFIEFYNQHKSLFDSCEKSLDKDQIISLLDTSFDRSEFL